MLQYCSKCGDLLEATAKFCPNCLTTVVYYKQEATKPLDVQVGGGHYKDYLIQPVEYCMVNNLNTCQSNVIKYVTRYKDKNGAKDICKAIHYLNIILQMEYGTTYEALTKED